MFDTKLNDAAKPLPNLTRLHDLWVQTGDESLRRLSIGEAPLGMAHPTSAEDWRNAVSSALMDCYRDTRDESVFAMLFELNCALFASFVRRGALSQRLDVDDVIQEAFLKIHRYPDHFRCERPDSFRKWGSRVVKNTLVTMIKSQVRAASPVDMSEFVELVDENPLPHKVADDRESGAAMEFAFLMYLNLYMVHYEKLSERERRALHLVEVASVSYRDTAESIGCTLTTLKMLLFRARQKIASGVQRSLRDLSDRAFHVRRPGTRRATAVRATPVLAR